MPQRAATIESLPAAFEVVKAMQAQGLDWGEGYRPLGRRALAEIIETEMAAAVDRWLESLEAEDEADRRNGYYRRSLLTELGDIELFVPRTRRPAPPPLLPDRGFARLRPAFARDRSDDPGRFRAWTFDPQARRGPAVPARPPGQPCDGEPGGAEPRSGGRGLPRPSGSGPLQGLDARRRRARPRRGGAAPPGSGGSGPQAGRQEGSDRLSPGARRKRRRMGTLPRRPLQARLNRRGPRHDLRRRRQGPPGRPAHGLRQDPCPALLGAQDPQYPQHGAQGRRSLRQGRSARGDERRHGCEGPLGRPPLRRALGGGLSRRGRLPARRSRRASHLLPLQDPRRTKGGADHQRHRTPLPRGPPQNPPPASSSL